MYDALTYEQIALLLALAFLLGVSIRPLRSALRAAFRAHRAARRATAPVRTRKRRRVKRTQLY